MDDHGYGGRGDLDRQTTAVAVLLAAALVAFLVSTISIVGADVVRVASILQPRLAGQVTIVVSGQGLESADAAAARAAEILSGQSGVHRVAVLDADESDVIVGSLTGGRSLGVDGTRLVSVGGAPDAIPSTPSLRRLLRADGLVATIDDHRGSAGALEAKALVAASLVIVLNLALAIGMFAVCWLSGLKDAGASNPRVDLMARLGADSAYIGGVIGGRLGFVALVGAVVGTVCADLCLLFATFADGFWRALGMAAFAEPQPRDGVWTIASPFVVALIAAIGGGLGARRGIAHRERRI